MDAVYGLCDGAGGCLVSAAEIMAVMRRGSAVGAEGVDRALCDLNRDGYFELISSSRAGRKMYVITLNERGLNFRRARSQRSREAVYRIALALLGAVATFVFGIILKAVWGG